MGYDGAKLRAELERDEGRRAVAYRDSRGILTVGVGFNLQANPLPEDVIDRLLDWSIAEAEMALDRLEPRWRELDDGRQRVLVNLAFNLGGAKLGTFMHFRAAVREYIDTRGSGALELAANELEDSDWYRQVGLRAVRLVELWRQSPTLVA